MRTQARLDLGLVVIPLQDTFQYGSSHIKQGVTVKYLEKEQGILDIISVQCSQLLGCCQDIGRFCSLEWASRGGYSHHYSLSSNCGLEKMEMSIIVLSLTDLVPTAGSPLTSLWAQGAKLSCSLFLYHK